MNNEELSELTMSFIRDSRLSEEQVKKFRDFLFEYNKIKIKSFKKIMKEELENERK